MIYSAKTVLIGPGSSSLERSAVSSELAERSSQEEGSQELGHFQGCHMGWMSWMSKIQLRGLLRNSQ